MLIKAPAVLQWLDIELEEPITTSPGSSTRTGGQGSDDVDPGTGDWDDDD